VLTYMFARSVCTGVVLVVLAVCVLDARTPVAAAATPNKSIAVARLAEGAGMGARPSVRVRRLQRVLEREGFDVGPSGADGRFGPLTAAAVRRFQDAYGLTADGIVGVKTRRLIALIAERQRSRKERATAQAPTGVRPRLKQGAAAARPTNKRPPAATTTRASGDITSQTASLAIAALAAALAAAALAMVVPWRRRRTDPGDLVPITQQLYLEGGDPRVGAFRGPALAAQVPRKSGDVAQASRYLVDDKRKPAPVWVAASAVRRARSELSSGARVVGYVTIDERTAPDGAALREIESVCAAWDWELTEVLYDESTPSFRSRPGLRRALTRIAAGEARGLVVSHIRRLAGSFDELAALLEWFVDAEAAVVIPELGLDTSTTAGYETASTLIGIARGQRGPRPGPTSAGTARLRSGTRSEGSS
jgi:peptidoglycan hydrolase-like protein with peptidoglycan-binding domain